MRHVLICLIKIFSSESVNLVLKKKPVALKFDRINERMEYLDELINRQATGTPKELAAKLGLSERTVYRYIRHYIDKGYKIQFCRYKKSYKISGD